MQRGKSSVVSRLRVARIPRRRCICRQYFFPKTKDQSYCSFSCARRHSKRRPTPLIMKGTVTRLLLPSGHVALIDTSDIPLVRPYVWYDYQERHTRYVFAQRKGGARIQLHRLLLGNPPFEIDHRNRNGLDNRRQNLRPATRTQNNANSQKRAGTTSVFKGVCRHKSAWVANAGGPGKKRYLGRFNSERDAALAYDRAAREIFGEFARLNFPDGAL